MDQCVGLDQLVPGEWGIVRKMDAVGSMRRRFFDIGLSENARVECIGRSPGGDPSAYRIRGAVIAIRACDSRSVHVQRFFEGTTP